MTVLKIKKNVFVIRENVSNIRDIGQDSLLLLKTLKQDLFPPIINALLRDFVEK